MKTKYIVYANHIEPENNIRIECSDIEDMDKYKKECERQGYTVRTEATPCHTKTSEI